MRAVRSLALTLAAAMAFALPACGGDDDDGGGSAREPGTVSTPSTLPEQAEDAPPVEVADFQSCVEEAGLQIFSPEEQIPGTDGGRLDVGVGSAEQIAVYWPESEHVADVFVAEDAEGAEQTEQELLEFFAGFGATEEQARQFVQRAGNVIVTPDNDSGPDEAELATLRECIG